MKCKLCGENILEVYVSYKLKGRRVNICVDCLCGLQELDKLDRILKKGSKWLKYQ